MATRWHILIIGCLIFAQGAAFGHPCDWYLTNPPAHVRDFLEADNFADLSIPHRKIDFSDLKKLIGPNFRETDHGNFIDFAKLSYGTARIDRSTFRVGDGSLEAELMKRSDVDGNPVEMNSFRAIKAGEGDVHSDSEDSNVFVAGINVPGKGMMVPAVKLGEAILLWTNKLVQEGRAKGFVALEIIHVHPIYELAFKEGKQPFVIFPPSEPDFEFAKDISRRQPKVVIVFTVLVPNGYQYSIALLNGKSITESALNSPAE